MKRFLSAVLALVCVMLLMPAAHAEQVKVSVTATPTELIDGGAVNFTFEIANYNADYPLMDVRIVYQGIEYDVLNGGSVPPSGTVRDIVLSLNVSESQLGQPLVFTVTWTLAGEPMSEEAEITIKRAADPVISVTRTANVQAAKPGDEIVLTYTIQNDTKFDITNIMLIDENISDNPILQHDALRASSSYSINHAYVMGEQSVVSAPFVTYTVNGKTKTFSSITPLTLTMMLVRLDMNIDMGAPTAQGVNFTFDIKNSGTQAVKSIQISDERANLVNGAPFSLAPGESTTFSFLVVPLLSEPLRNVKFLLTGIDPFNETYTLSSSETYQVYPFVDASEISVSARAETVTPWTAESGAVTARIIITNHSTVGLTNV